MKYQCAYDVPLKSKRLILKNEDVVFLLFVHLFMRYYTWTAISSMTILRQNVNDESVLRSRAFINSLALNFNKTTKWISFDWSGLFYNWIGYALNHFMHFHIVLIEFFVSPLIRSSIVNNAIRLQLIFGSAIKLQQRRIFQNI